MTHLKKILNCAFFITLIFLLSSCSKENSEKINTANNQNLEVAEIPADDISEKDEDLLTVDYKVFYDELAPHGEWIEVTGKELGLDLKKGSGSGANQNSNHRRISLSQLFGINDAYAADFEFGSFFVWKPSSDLAIGVTAGDAAVAPVYTPYTNGQWVYSSYGWYFKAPTAHEEIVHHYGRWVHSPAIGWTWVPGRVWAPAWVEWREDDVNIAWSPIPPSVYIVAGEIPVLPVYEDSYVIVEKRYFVEPVVYNYIYSDKEYKKLLKSMRRPKGVVIVNNVIVNQGPAVLEIERYYGSNIGVVKVHKVDNIKDIQFTGTELNVFAPKFRKVKSNDKITYNHFQPRKYTKYDETSMRNEEQKRLESASKNNKSDKNFDKNKNDNAGKNEKVNKKNTFEKKNDNSKSNDKNRIDNNKNSKKRNEIKKENNNKKQQDINKGNDGKQNRKSNGVKENKKSRENSNGNQNKRQEKKQERKSDGKKRSYYDDENNYNLTNSRNGHT
jgi:hypothetical protein